ncbi:MAG: geranylgeranylglyceryl/heptaprenylglyceryl phosphate synthase [Halobacteriota archaeon]
MSRFATLSRRFETCLTALRVAGRRLLRLDTNPVPSEWTHVTKVDPEDDKPLPLLFPLYLSHTSAISVGGSRDVTSQNTEETFSLLQWAAPPAFHEPSAAAHVTETTRRQAAFLAIPEVLNGDSEALVGTLGAGIDYIRNSLVPTELAASLPWWVPDRLCDRLADVTTSLLLSRAVFEAYIIQNPDSAAAREANVSEDDVLTPDEARQRAMAAERHLGSEIVYLEYSGTFGGDEAKATLEALRESVGWSRIWYGGGVTSAAEAASIREAGADTVVVGNVFHDIAAGERRICDAAAAALGPSTNRDEVAEWIDRNVDMESHAGRRYLSTVPDVTDPERKARRYLIATVQTWLEIRAGLGERGSDDAEDTVEVDGRRSLTALEAVDLDASEFRSLVGESATPYVRAVVRGLQRASEDGDRPPMSHLSIAHTLAAT